MIVRISQGDSMVADVVGVRTCRSERSDNQQDQQ